MVLTDILDILKSDTDLQSLLNGTTADKKIYAFDTTKLNSIVYKYADLQSNKIVGQARLELTVSTTQADYNLNLQIVSKIKQLLLTLGSEQLNQQIIEIQQNGGGILKNELTNTIHNKITFTIKYREEV